MRKKGWFLIAFFLLLFLGFYFALTRFIPGFGEVQLPVLSYVHPFSFDNQEGRLITDKDVSRKGIWWRNIFSRHAGESVRR